MTKQEIRDFIATGGLGLIFTPKNEKKKRDSDDSPPARSGPEEHHSAEASSRRPARAADAH